MAQVELGLLSESARDKTEGPSTPFKDLLPLRYFVDDQLGDLEEGFNYKTTVGRTVVESEVARGLVQDSLSDIGAAMTAVSTGEVESRLVLWDHPARRNNYLLEKQRKLAERGVNLNYEVLNFVFRRCLYSVLAFGLGAWRTPNTEEQLVRLEEKYFREDAEIVVPVKRGSYVIFICSVKPIEVGRYTLYERKWVVKPGPTEEELWESNFGDYFERLPLPSENQVVFREAHSLDPEDTVPDIASVTYLDRQTDKPAVRFEVYIGPYTRGVEREREEFVWRTDDNYQHLVTGEMLRAEVVEVRISRANRNWRRREKMECRRLAFLLLEQDWSLELGEPKKLRTALEQGDYERMGKSIWIEKTRIIFLPGGLVVYERDDEGDMRGGWFMPSDEEERKRPLGLGEVPENLGPARRMRF